MKHSNTKNLVLSAIFAALTFIATTFLRIPPLFSGVGYIHFGDCLVLMCGFILGPLHGAFAAGLGSALSDIIGFPVYAPGTLIIKALVALVAGLLLRLFKKKTVGAVICGFIAELIMVFGYFIYETLIIPDCGFYVALSSIPGSIVQAVSGIIGAAILIQIFLKKK